MPLEPKSENKGKVLTYIIVYHSHFLCSNCIHLIYFCRMGHESLQLEGLVDNSDRGLKNVWFSCAWVMLQSK